MIHETGSDFHCTLPPSAACDTPAQRPSPGCRVSRFQSGSSNLAAKPGQSLERYFGQSASAAVRKTVGSLGELKMWVEFIAIGLLVFVVLALNGLRRELRSLGNSFETLADAVSKATGKYIHVTVTTQDALPSLQNTTPSLQDAPGPPHKKPARVWPDA